MEETSSSPTNSHVNHAEEPSSIIRPSSTSPGPPPSKRSAPGLESNQKLPSISSMRAEITSTDCTDSENNKDHSPELITGDLNPLSGVSSNNLTREYSNGSFMQQQPHDEIQLDHSSNNHHQRSIPSFQSNTSNATASSSSSSYYTFQNELQPPPQVTPTHTQHHMGWMQQHQSQLILQQASYHDHNYNAGIHTGLPHLMTTTTSSPPSGMNNNNNAVTSTSPPETSGMNFYNPQSPYYGIHPQSTLSLQQQQPLNQQSSASSSIGGSNNMVTNANANNNSNSSGGGGAYGGHFAYPPLPVVQMSHHQQQQQQQQQQNNFGGGSAALVPGHHHLQQSQSSSSFNQQSQQQHQQMIIRNKHQHHQNSSSMLMMSSQQQQQQQQQQHAMTMASLGNDNGGGGNNKSPWTLSTESPYPGGLEVLWREVPEECQKLMNLQDVPETARQRGYFTVCELIALKRSLVSRMGHERRHGIGHPNQEQHLQHQLRSQSDATTANNAACAALSEMSSVGMAVKDAMNTLHEVGDVSNPTDGQTVNETNNSNSNNNQTQLSETICMQNSGKSHHYNAADSSTTFTLQGTPHNNQGGSSHSSSSKRLSSDSSSVGPPPPYRTATLVFKLLVIGGYQFRSFSEVNPNRLRVLFNTQRLTYECQLSIVRPPREGMPVLRKLLTVDIGFDQISVIRFGTDKLFLRVEGPPLLTVTYNPANDDMSCPPLSQQDLHLLEQIDKGQLKLSPCHQLYFLNERLVHLLEYQFKELPRFRHILQESFNDHQQQQQQHNMMNMASSSSSSSSQSNNQQQQNQTQNSIIDIP